MPTLSGNTLAEDRAATVLQIRTAMKARIDLMTKRQLIVLDLWCDAFDKDAALSLSDHPITAVYADGQAKSQLVVSRDALGAKTGSTKIAWTYYKTGEVDTITISQLDSADVVTSVRTITHFRDGRQPVTTS